MSFPSDALVVLAGEQRMFCRTVDLSATGLLMLPRRRAALGTELQLDINLPCLTNALIEAVVIREAAAHGLHAWGVRFVRVPTYIRAVLRDFVRQRRRGVPPGEMVFTVDEARRSSVPGYGAGRAGAGSSLEAIGSRTAEDLERLAAELAAEPDDSAGMYVKVFRHADDRPIPEPIPSNAPVAPGTLRGVAPDERARLSSAGTYAFSGDNRPNERVRNRRPPRPAPPPLPRSGSANARGQARPAAPAPTARDAPLKADKAPPRRGGAAAVGARPRPSKSPPGPTRPASSKEVGRVKQDSVRRHTPVELRQLYRQAIAELEASSKTRKKKGNNRRR